MTLPVTVAVALFLGVLAYALFGGADFGAGFWTLFLRRFTFRVARRVVRHYIAGRPNWRLRRVLKGVRGGDADLELFASFCRTTFPGLGRLRSVAFLPSSFALTSPGLRN